MVKKSVAEMPLFVVRHAKKRVAEMHLLATLSLTPLARHEAPFVRQERTAYSLWRR
jgi:hypothetical protein